MTVQAGYYCVTASMAPGLDDLAPQAQCENVLQDFALRPIAGIFPLLPASWQGAGVVFPPLCELRIGLAGVGHGFPVEMAEKMQKQPPDPL